MKHTYLNEVARGEAIIPICEHAHVSLNILLMNVVVRVPYIVDESWPSLAPAAGARKGRTYLVVFGSGGCCRCYCRLVASVFPWRHHPCHEVWELDSAAQRRDDCSFFRCCFCRYCRCCHSPNFNFVLYFCPFLLRWSCYIPVLFCQDDHLFFSFQMR